MPKKAFRYLYKLLHEGYLDARKRIRMHLEAIRILKDGIRMSVTQTDMNSNDESKNSKQIHCKLAIVLGNQNKEHYTLITFDMT